MRERRRRGSAGLLSPALLSARAAVAGPVMVRWLEEGSEMRKSHADGKPSDPLNGGLRDTQLTGGWSHLNKDAQKPKHGANRHPKCDICGTSTRLKRREAHPARGPKYELQTFTCTKCGHVQQRDAASPGAA
jgi:hypothetical protein